MNIMVVVKQKFPKFTLNKHISIENKTSLMQTPISEFR